MLQAPSEAQHKQLSVTHCPPATGPGFRLSGSPAPKAAKVLKVASRHSVLARKLSTSASVKGPPGAPVLAARAAAAAAEQCTAEGAGGVGSAAAQKR